MFTFDQARFDAGFDAVIAGIEKHSNAIKSELFGALNEAAWHAYCETQFKEASRSCGQSYSYFVKLFSSTIEGRVSRLPEYQRMSALEIAGNFGYETPEARAEEDAWDHEHGFCHHGIELGHCPCGCE
jgi:hypothetical protein